MTRFLGRALSECAGSNNEIDRLFDYHQATKHTFESVRTSARQLDWRNQPNPFRVYDGAPTISLPTDPGFPNAGTLATIAELASAAQCAPMDPGLDGAWLSRLLWHSVAISAWKEIAAVGARYSLRVNPSSGNLHPTEAYLSVQGFQGIDNGLYHYRVSEHALERRVQTDWTQKLASTLAMPWISESPLVVVLTSIFWREAWKYRDRAYRYCCHDLGHAMISVLLSARALGLAGGVVAHFSDVPLSALLGIDGSDEAPMAILIFRPSIAAAKPRSDARPEKKPAAFQFEGTANQLSVEEIPYDLLLGMHRSTILPHPAGPLNRYSPALSNDLREDQQELCLQSPARDLALATVVRKRRSALDFDGRTPPMERADMEQLLDFATRDWRADWRGNFNGETSPESAGVDFISLYIYCHRVHGHEPGVYLWHARDRTLELLHCGNVQRVAEYLSLEQTLAGNSCFTISMIANLAAAARAFGNRAYRYVYFEAGAIGQRLYVGAEALGWNATGIGAFYDDDVHRYLGFLPDAEEGGAAPVDSPQPEPRTLPRQVIYHFAVGRAIADPRIQAPDGGQTAATSR